MTTIATDGRLIAADGQSSLDGVIINSQKDKIVVRHGRIFALAGDSPARDLIFRYVNDYFQFAAHPHPLSPPELPVGAGSWQVLVITPERDEDGRYVAYVFADELPHPVRVPTPFALGSGGQFALGAMEAGASPAEAVLIAAKRDPATNDFVRVIDISRELLPRAMVADAA